MFKGQIFSHSECLLALVKPNFLRLAMLSALAEVSEPHSQ